MGKSIIISSTNKSFVQGEIAKIKTDLNIVDSNTVDVFEISSLEGKAISIEQTRKLKSWSITKPYFARSKLAIIQQAHLLTIAAQNSLLKLLEEPNTSISIILTTHNYNLLLITVLSRCELRDFYQLEKSEDQFPDFISQSLITQFQTINNLLKIKDRAEQSKKISALLVSLITHYRNLLFHEKSNKKTMEKLNLISETKKMLDFNVNQRLALENLLINLD